MKGERDKTNEIIKSRVSNERKIMFTPIKVQTKDHTFDESRHRSLFNSLTEIFPVPVQRRDHLVQLSSSRVRTNEAYGYGSKILATPEKKPFVKRKMNKIPGPCWAFLFDPRPPYLHDNSEHQQSPCVCKAAGWASGFQSSISSW